MIQGCPHGSTYMTGRNCSECQREGEVAAQRLINVADALSEVVLKMSDAEIAAECIADGFDPEQQTAETKRILRDAFSLATKG